MKRSLCCGILGGVLTWLAVAEARPEDGSGWGVDAVLSGREQEADVLAYLDLLKPTGVQFLRERNTSRYSPVDGEKDYRPLYSLMRAAGFKVVAFAQENRDLGRTSWGPFPADLRTVYEEGRRLGRDFADYVDVWELHNEPDLGWWPDMPDRYAAHAKALYLGLKAGAREARKNTPVLSGALGLPPGPWLERTACSGLLNYGDAWNAHYYGEASQLSGFLAANQQAMRELLPAQNTSGARPGLRWPVKNGAGRPLAGWFQAPMPIWLTEVGLKTVTEATWGEPDRRRRQADFLISTARQALADPAVAVFMPFVLSHPGDPYALTEGATTTWPAWNAYARLTKEAPWPKRPLYMAPKPVSPVILQWLADGETASGHKVAGAYRWKSSGMPIQGELRIYNFGDRAVSGRLRGATGPEARLGDIRKKIDRGQGEFSGLAGAEDKFITVEAGGLMVLPLSFPLAQAPAPGRREWRQYCFYEADGRVSELGFALEREPGDSLFESEKLLAEPWGKSDPQWSLVPNHSPEGRDGVWRTINGVHVLTGRQDGLARFEITGDPTDPEHPPMAAIRVANDFAGYTHLRVSSRNLLPEKASVRIDLVDEAGRRFTVWENLGRSHGQGKDDAIWMALADFHPYAWGKLDGRRRLRPNEVRQVQLRFYAPKAPAMIDVEVNLAKRR